MTEACVNATQYYTRNIRRKKSGLAAPRNPPLRQIVRAHFQLDRVPFDDADIVHSQLSRDVRRDDVPVGKPDFERCVGKRLDDLPFRLDDVVFGHNSYLSLTG